MNENNVFSEKSCRVCKSLVPPIIVSLLVGALVGNFLGREYYLELGMENARAKLEKAGILQPIPQESFSVFGKVVFNDGQKIKLEVAPAYDPLSDQKKPEIKNLSLEPKTEVIKRVFDEKAQLGAIPYKDTKMEIANIAVGDQIVVESNENVIGKSKIVAKKIIAVK